MPDLNIAFIVFNRPLHTQKTFQSIREHRPEKLFIIADGPRRENINDSKNCELVRSVVEAVDWPCSVYRNYADTNMGLKKRVSSGLDWVFSQVEDAIILEDDCLAHADFYHFCTVLLDKYRNDNRIFAITGDNFQNGQQRGEGSYYFSKYPHCWGWATWRRAWEKYEGGILFWPKWKNSTGWEKINPNKNESDYWVNIFNEVYAGRLNSWAFPWMASVWQQGGLTITPNSNLVTNIGIGPDGTNTINENKTLEIPTSLIGFIKDAAIITQDCDADRYVFETIFDPPHIKETSNQISKNRQSILTRFLKWCARLECWQSY